MSLDANYLLVYENLTYVKPTPMQNDIQYLQKKFGGSFKMVTETTIYWGKPKYLLPEEEIIGLMADQILERRDCELWRIIK